METHTERIARLRQAYREARARFFKRLSEAPADAVERSPGDGCWSAAQIGWHVAVVDALFAGIISGEIPGAKELAAGESARSWAEIKPAIPGKTEAVKRVQPPPEAKQPDVLEALLTSAAKMDAALAGLDEARGARYAIKHPVIGVVSLADVGEWATAHVIRHNAQAKRTLQP